MQLKGYAITLFGFIVPVKRFDINNRNHFLTREYAAVVAKQRKAAKAGA